MPRRGASPSRAPSRPYASLPARTPQSAVAHPPAQPRQPGLMGQMAATAGGVAVGHVVGSAITGAFSGGAGSSPAQSSAPAVPSDQYQSPCQFQVDELIKCAQTQSDISACSGFSEALKECSRHYGLYQ
ncbi:Coiled-coil-helix-coiled-coil-helix domain-containing protein 10 [Schistosoma japonicum]|uniref:CHCH domain-containing protein C22orf16, mitochondrial n=2 Tax=Schistosoma japonicum TaxID=6182 RepID=Q5DDK5_SCHJA|nr:unknown [Schistosoma japonicum]AAX30191.1 SJCHGC01762 protein [Schistosoma japonicum]KAH8854026.1 Coiled-coil-helix-coiled-coil-helix domain-containing protein 10, mitochondrial [Schistosoma japonicum]TNN20837.1 Coiled-coil-helix-coiled-coil-helix domain-containing protein 10 [Schistosoma japonicum]CAX71919.1 CHCH domain-containing protein C22orf16, mitochondrial precursor [Schistosoma japonicum]